MKTGMQERARMTWCSFDGSRPIRLRLRVPVDEEEDGGEDEDEGVRSHVEM
jgi:hypothetical protein